MSKNRKQRQAEQLGMPVGTARSKLHRNLIWKLLLRHGENLCAHCDDWISNPEELAITHFEPWLDNEPSLFWEYDNVAFMHRTCAAEHGATKPQEGKTEMSTVETLIVDENGTRLPGIYHEGKVYVAGQHGERYQVRLTNTSSSRVEVVLTVDGRDVIKGEPGSVETRGYILGPHEDTTIEGWRTSDDTVAAFRFGADKSKAYSAQLGTGAHLGVIGVAVFKEKKRRRSLDGMHVLRSTRSSGVERGGGTFGSTFGSSGADDFSLTVDYSSAGAPRSRRVTKSKVQTREEVKLGTKFGEELQSKVSHTTFTRATKDPSQVLTVEYDSWNNLERRGIPIARSKEETPSPFPADNNGYCKPPVSR